MIDTEPRWSWELCPLAPFFIGPTEPRPLTLATYSVLPSFDSTTPPGYQPVGIRPSGRLGMWSLGNSLSRSIRPLPSITTVTQLLLPLATYSPSGRARAMALQP